MLIAQYNDKTCSILYYYGVCSTISECTHTQTSVAVTMEYVLAMAAAAESVFVHIKAQIQIN